MRGVWQCRGNVDGDPNGGDLGIQRSGDCMHVNVVEAERAIGFNSFTAGHDLPPVLSHSGAASASGAPEGYGCRHYAGRDLFVTLS